MRLAFVLTLLLLASQFASAQPLPVAPPPRPVEPAFNLADWTPRPATGQAEPWEKKRDPEWDDARFRLMDTGPFLNATFQYPLGKGKETVYKGTAIRLGEKGDAGVIFDRSNLRLAALWTGGYLQHSNRRFGLLNTPTPKGSVVFGTPSWPGWADPNGKWETKSTGTTLPLRRDWAKYRGLYAHGDRVVLKYTVNGTTVLDAPRLEVQDKETVLTRTLVIGPRKAGLTHMTFSRWHAISGFEVPPTKVEPPKKNEQPGQRPAADLVVFPFSQGAELIIPAGDDTLTGTVTISRIPAKPEDVIALTKPGPRHWGKPLVTRLVRGTDDGPFAIDTLTIPYDNPFKALFFCTGVDTLPDGRVAVCTCHGDVWLVRIDEAKAECHWQRYATGLYQPLGLKVVEGKVVVLERGQLTRLHDENGDGEADFYENLCNDWHTGSGEHSYDTCLETDPQGNFYFFKTGDTNLPHGGCLMKVSKDGAKVEVFATGFRHPIGLGASPTGIVTGGDQEGNWMPATRLDEYKKGGFYGDMRAHHRDTPPKLYDGPLCWLPREVDNSAGGQVWVPDGKWGPLGGLPLHFSYGRCKAFVLLRQETPTATQGGVWDLGLRFLSGSKSGRFAADGNLYVCGLNGWQTSAQADGCLQRVRHTGKPLDVPVKMEVVPDGVKLTFSRELDKASAENSANYRAAWWNYKWSGDYGSKRYKLSDGQEGQDEVPVKAAKLLADGKTVHVRIDGMRPVMQMQVGANVKAKGGRAVVGSVYLTVHDVGK